MIAVLEGDLRTPFSKEEVADCSWTAVGGSFYLSRSSDGIFLLIGIIDDRAL